MGKSERLSQSWKKRLEYTDGLFGTKFHNIWRSFKFTIKGKKIGCSNDWNLFRNFKSDMYQLYVEGMSLYRKDKKAPFSKENCYFKFKENYESHLLTVLEYNGETKTLKDWCLKYDLNYNGVRQRYFKGKNYTPDDILFGKKKRLRRNSKKWSDDHAVNRIKASKMLSQYKLKDFKKGFIGFDLDTEWFIENISTRSCVYCWSSDFIGADRILNSKGHIKENIVPCCFRCNATRGNNFTHEEMKKIGKFIRENIDCER